MNQVRGILPHQAALLQGLHHQRHVALFQIADTAVDQLSGTAGSALAEIVLLNQGYVVTAGSGVDGHANSCGAAADDHHVPGLGALAEAARHLGANHDSIHPFDRSTARCH